MNLPKRANPWENARRHAAAWTMPATPMPQNARAVATPARRDVCANAELTIRFVYKGRDRTGGGLICFLFVCTRKSGLIAGAH